MSGKRGQMSVWLTEETRSKLQRHMLDNKMNHRQQSELIEKILKEYFHAD
jgi:hypothetical protein